MTAASYIPGAWLGLIRSGTAVILDPATPSPLVSTVWELLADAPDAADVLHAVAGGFGAPLSATPCFGIIGYTDSLRVFLRGDIDLTVHLPSGLVTLDGRNVTTWTERWLDAPEWFSVAVPAAAAAHPASPAPVPAAELPLTEGAVLLQSLRVSVTEPARIKAVGRLPDGPASSAPLPEASAETMVAPAEDLSVATGLELPPGPEHEPEPESEVSAETVAGLQDTVTGFTETGAAVAGTLPGEALQLKAPSVEPPALEAPSVEPPALDYSPATELTSSYDHLWDKTVVRSIEDAAVRTGEDDGGAGAGQEAAVPETAGQETESQNTESQNTESQETGGQENKPGEAGQPVRETAAQVPPSAPVPAGPTVSGQAVTGLTVTGQANSGLIDSVLIDSVPWATGGDRAPRNQDFAAPLVPPSFSPAPGPGTDAEGDHDGQTILKSDLPAPGAQQAGRGQEPDRNAAAGNGPLVLARVCPAGHANPPTSSQCFTCGAKLPDVAVQVPRPRLGRLRLSTGELIDLDESLVIGRQPSVSRVQGGTMPRLIQVASPGGDISRSHVEVRLEGWHVMLCDLKATNGTVLVREGQPPRRLAQNEMAIVLDGDIAELGDDVSLRFEEIL